MSALPKRRALKWVGLCAFCAIIVLAGNGHTTLFDRDEARFALAVKEMTERGNLVVPTNWGEPRYHKPILIYWLAMASERLFGQGEWALRFPSAMCGMLVCLLTTAAARRWFGERVAWRAGFVLATALFFVMESKILTADAALLLSTTASFWAWGELRRGPRDRRGWQLLFWLGVGVGLLAKVVNVAFLAVAGCALGYLQSSWTRRQHAVLWAVLASGAVAVSIPGLRILGPVILGAVVLFFFARSLRSPEGRGAWAALGWPWGLPLALAIALIWVGPALVQTHGAFLTEGLGHHLFARTARPFEGHAGVPGYYLATTLVTFFPWGGLLPLAVRSAWERLRHDHHLAFVVSWIVGPWVLLELVSTKLPHYLLVGFPALAILVAAEWERREAGGTPCARWMQWGEAALLLVPCLAITGGTTALAWVNDQPRIRVTALALGLVALGYGLRGARCLTSTAHARAFRFLVAGAAVLYLVLALATLPALEAVRISRPLGAAVARHLQPGERLVVHKFTDASVGYYLPRPAEVLDDRREVARALSTTGPSALIVVPNGKDAPRLDEVLKDAPVPYDRLEIVRGMIFLDFKRHEVWLVRSRKAG